MYPDTFPANPNRGQVTELDNNVGVQGAATPDTSIAAEADLAAAADMDAELQETTADARIAGGHLPQEPDEARAEDDPQATQATDSREGKLVFKPNELNQSGEDKEYFHPKGDHKFNAPKDANEHALTPDIEVTPDNTIKTIR